MGQYVVLKICQGKVFHNLCVLEFYAKYANFAPHKNFLLYGTWVSATSPIWMNVEKYGH